MVAAKELLPSLTNGRQVILREMGHVDDLVNLQRTAVEHLLVRFYNEGVIDDSKFKYDAMNFEPAIRFPLWAKVLYPFVLIFSFFLLSLMEWIDGRQVSIMGNSFGKIRVQRSAG